MSQDINPFSETLYLSKYKEHYTLSFFLCKLEEYAWLSWIKKIARNGEQTRLQYRFSLIPESRDSRFFKLASLDHTSMQVARAVRQNDWLRSQNHMQLSQRGRVSFTVRRKQTNKQTNGKQRLISIKIIITIETENRKINSFPLPS